MNGKLNAVYFGDFSGELFDSFINVAKSNEKFAFFQAAGDCAAANGAKSNSVMVTRNFDESPIYYSGESNTGDIQNWLDLSAIPVVIEFSEDYIEPIFGKGRAALILFTNDRDASYNKIFSDAASALKGKILFVVSGTEQGI